MIESLSKIFKMALISALVIGVNLGSIHIKKRTV
jgi:hypothetical protein